MPLSPHTRLGPYEIVSAIGAGGMGEVYKARDTRLDRTVAIKVLPEHRYSTRQSRERFEREAKAISSLNHPHICTLHDVGHQDGIDYLVMEYLEGLTLADRLKKGPLPLDQALQYAIQITDALDAAHRRGVIHRDLKPGNIMLTKAGVKLLDFGLAKTRAAEAVGGVTALPTQTTPLTGEGTILGTLQYMAPEQLEGKDADARTDIFALGAVIYEMSTGRKPFEGKSHASLIAAILEHEPAPISTLQPLTPLSLDHVVRSCLAKDPDERRQSAHDLMLELKWVAEGAFQTVVPESAASRRNNREIIAWAMMTITAAIALTLAAVHFRKPPSGTAPIRLSLFPPEKATFEQPLAISPDGALLALIVSTPRSPPSLWLRRMDSVITRPLPGTEHADSPFWSPDSRFIGFFARGKLKKIDTSGGTLLTACEAPDAFSGTWSRKGVIVFAQSGRLYQVPSDGGQATSVTVLDQSAEGSVLAWPHFLPDDRHFLYLGFHQKRENEGIYIGSLESKESKRLLSSHSMPVYARVASGPGYLLFVRDGALMAQQFDEKNLQVTGEPVPVTERVVDLDTNAFAKVFFSASTNGLLAYHPGEFDSTELMWFDRTGTRLGTVEMSGWKFVPKLSPNGKQVAIEREDPQTGKLGIWLLDVARGTASRFTFETDHSYAPVWSPDGDRVVYASIRDGIGNLYQKASNGAVNEELLLKLSKEFSYPTDWSSDGRFIAYTNHSPKTQGDLWVLPLEGDRKPFPFLQTQFNETYARFSPDGRWLAYQSDESGKWEVYVRTFNRGLADSGKWQISTHGGIHPIWRRDGKELFYIAADRKLMAVEVKAEDRMDHSVFEPGVPKTLFDTGTKFSTVLPYTVSGDGQRFLVITKAAEDKPQTITVVINWTAGLKH